MEKSSLQRLLSAAVPRCVLARCPSHWDVYRSALLSYRTAEAALLDQVWSAAPRHPTTPPSGSHRSSGLRNAAVLRRLPLLRASPSRAYFSNARSAVQLGRAARPPGWVGVALSRWYSKVSYHSINDEELSALQWASHVLPVVQAGLQPPTSAAGSAVVPALVLQAHRSWCTARSFPR